MKLNKIMKVIMVILLLALITSVFSQIVMADAPDPTTFTGEGGEDGGAKQSVTSILNVILGMAQIIGVGVAVIMLVVLAIQYIAASPEGKAEIKKNSTVYIVGAVILFAASGILQIIKSFSKNIQSAGANNSGT